MKRVIWKYLIGEIVPSVVPKGARIIQVGPDLDGVICFWAIVDPDEKETESVQFSVIMTGQKFELQDGMTHTSTFNFRGLVIHIFEKWIS